MDSWYIRWRAKRAELKEERQKLGRCQLALIIARDDEEGGQRERQRERDPTVSRERRGRRKEEEEELEEE